MLLQQTLNHVHDQITFSYEHYETDCRIIELDLTATEDSHLKVLTNKTKGYLKSKLTFTQDNNVNLICFYIGEFRNH